MSRNKLQMGLRRLLVPALVLLLVAGLLVGLPGSSSLPGLKSFSGIARATPPPSPSTTQIDLNTSGGQPNGSVGIESAMSDTGRYIAFSSFASDLVSGDTNSAEDVFVYDSNLHTTTLVSVTGSGGQGNGWSNHPSTSGDGRFVAFASGATNLVTGDTNGFADVFLKDMQTGTLTRVSVDSSGGQATGGYSESPGLSADGRYVAFDSAATNLVTGDTNGTGDAFLRDTFAQTTIRVSVGDDESQATGSSGIGNSNEVSADGRYVIFFSLASNLVSGDTNGVQDAFVRDILQGSTTRASLGNNGVQPNYQSIAPLMSVDGRYVSFDTTSTNLIDSNCPGGPCFEVYQRDTQSGTTTLVSASSAGVPADEDAGGLGLSSNGRYVIILSAATNLGPTGVTEKQLFIHDLTDGSNSLASVNTSGAMMGAGGGSGPSADATYVAFNSGDHLYLRFNPVPSVPSGQGLGNGAGIDAACGVPCGVAGQRIDLVGDPVNLSNGSFYETYTDAAVPNIGVPFAITRTYNSADATPPQLPSPLGATIDPPIPMSRGWSSSYNLYLRKSGWKDDLTLRLGDGQQVEFLKQTNGAYLGGPGVRDKLVKNQDGSFTITRTDQVKYQFDSSGNVTSIKDRNNQGLTFTYTSGHITSISGSGPGSITLAYTSGRLSSMSFSLSRSVSYRYNASGLLDQVTDVRGNYIQYSYTTTADSPQPTNLLKTITDQRGNVVAQNTYGSTGRVTSQVDARQHTLSYGWTPRTETATFTDARGKVWTYGYSNGTLVKMTDPLGNSTLFGYDGDLNTKTVTDARGNQTTYTYDDNGNLIQEVAPSPLGYQRNWTYDAATNNLVSFTDGRSPRRTTLYGYDSAGNLTCTTIPSSSPAASCSAASSSSKTTFGRDPGGTGLLWSVTDPNGNTTSFRYTNKGQLEKITTQLGYVSRMCYDAGGRMTSMVGPRGSETCGQGGPFTSSLTYNPANQLLTAADPLSNTTTLSYDGDGNLKDRTDGNGHVTRYEYDAANNLTCVIAPTTSATTCASAPQASKTTYAYDNNDGLITRTDGNNHAWTWDYDDAGRLAHTTSPRGKVWAHDYWADGSLKTKTLPSGGTITYDYDELARPEAITYSGTITPNVTFGYDANDNRTSMTDGSGSVSYAYDDANRLTSATRGTDAFSYTYYAGGELKQITYPDSSTVGYQYDGDGRLCTMTSGGITTNCSNPLSTTTTMGYNAAADLTSKSFPNSYVSTFTYDQADRLTGVSNVRNGTTLSSFTFGSRDAAGNPTSLTTVSGNTYYTYDAMDRLTGACNLSGCSGSGLTGLGYTYDPVGNRLTEVRYGNPSATTTYVYNGDDQICWTYAGTTSNACSNPPAGATNYTFSVNGNQTGAGAWSYTYDLEGRLRTASNGATTTYAYDGDGNRVSATTGSTVTKHLWDVNAPLPDLAMERDGSGNLLRRYAYGAGLTSMTTGGQSFYELPDAFGSVANLTSSSGDTEWIYGYDPFGASNSTKVDPNAPDNPMGYDGEYVDAVTGLLNLRARVLDPGTGRFLSQDPVANPIGSRYDANYVYVSDRPTVLADPSGLCADGKAGIGDIWSEIWRNPIGSWNEGWHDKSGCPWPSGLPGIGGMYCEGFSGMSPFWQGFWAAALDFSTTGLALLLPVKGLAVLQRFRWVRASLLSLNRTKAGGRIVTILGGLLKYVGTHEATSNEPQHSRQIEFLWKRWVWRF